MRKHIETTFQNGAIVDFFINYWMTAKLKDGQRQYEGDLLICKGQPSDVTFLHEYKDGVFVPFSIPVAVILKLAKEIQKIEKITTKEIDD